MAFFTQGIFSQTTPHFGFVMTAHGEELYIAKNDIGGAFSGDTVNVRIKRREKEGKKAEAVIIHIVKRTDQNLIGTFHLNKGNTHSIVTLYQSPTHTSITVPQKYWNSAKHGDIVSLNIVSGIEKPIGRITEIIGNENEKDIEERIVLLQNNIHTEFSDEVHMAIKKLSPRL